MKKKLNLFKLNERESRKVTGGVDGTDAACICGCAYVNCGGSDSYDNGNANCTDGLISPDTKPVC